MSRYIPELQSLCAKKIAEHSRSLSPEDRYYFLKEIPKHLQDLVRSFPISFLEWCEYQCYLSMDSIHYLKDKPQGKSYMTQSFEEDCEKGYVGKIMWRKCSNYYCGNQKLSRIISRSDFIPYGLCNECRSHRIKILPYRRLLLNIRNIYLN